MTLDQAICQRGLYCGGNIPQNISDRVDQSAAQLPETKAATATIASTGDLLPFAAVPKLFYTEEEAINLGRYATDVLAYIKENTVKFITGERSLDEWDDYVNTIKGMNLDRYLEIYQAAFDRWKE